MWGSIQFIACSFVICSGHTLEESFSINWNLSMNFGLLKNERLYEYPMFTEVAPSPCDLTVGFCDIGCCLDPDCSDEEKNSFRCVRETGVCRRPFAHYDCNCNLRKPFWFPALCYVFENPIYLGMFYSTPPKVENLNVFQSKINGKNVMRYKTRRNESPVQQKIYRYGSQILSYASRNGIRFPSPHALFREVDAPQRIVHDCFYPVLYMRDRKYSCYIRLSKKSCEDGFPISARAYLLANAEIEHAPYILRSLESEQRAHVNMNIRSSQSSYVNKTIIGKQYKYYFLNETLGSFIGDKNMLDTYWNGSHCNNVLAHAEFEFITNASEIMELNLQFTLTNISLEMKQSASEEIFYLKKFHKISFKSVSTRKVNNVSDNYFHNRGYYMGEDLNFGSTRGNKTHISYWEKGYLAIFVNGGDCRRLRNITFGYDSYANCRYRSYTSNCTLIRDGLRRTWDLLTNGDRLAPYGNYRDVQRSAVPLLREYNTPPQEEPNETSTCLLPVRQTFYVLYTTSVTDRGFLAHRIIGAMAVRNSETVPAAADPITLTSEVIFVRTSTERRKPLSRYWQKIFSPEESENAWINILSMFDGENELDDGKFWFLLLVLVSCLTMAAFGTRR